MNKKNWKEFFVKKQKIRNSKTINIELMNIKNKTRGIINEAPHVKTTGIKSKEPIFAKYTEKASIIPVTWESE